MTDLSLTIAPRSDQLNADTLIGGPITIRVTRVVKSDAAEQPIKIYFEGDDNKPYLPCKSMRRVLVQVWGKDGNSYVGRSMTLYRDPTVKFGGDAVGGIRISHMDGIDKPVTLALTVTRGSRKPYIVQVLQSGAAKLKSAKAEPPAVPIGDRIAAVKKALRETNTIAGVGLVRKNAAGLFADLAHEPANLTDDLSLAFESRQAEIEEAK